MVANERHRRRSHRPGRDLRAAGRTVRRYFPGVALTATTVSATLLAGLSIILPVGLPSGRAVSDASRTVTIFSLPQSTAAGMSVALGTALILANLQRALISWATALAGAVAILLGHTVLAKGTMGTSLTSLNYLDAVAGGLLLAGVSIGMRPGRAQFVGWVVGALGVIWVGGSPPATNAVNPNQMFLLVDWYTGESPPRWLIVSTLVLLLISAYYDRLRADLPALTYELPVAPVLSCSLIVFEAMTLPKWVSHHSHSVPAIAAAVVGEILTAWIASLLLPGRDGSLVLVVSALAAVGQAAQPPLVAGLVALVVAALAAGGVLLAIRRQNPSWAIVGVLVVAVFDVLTYRTAAGDHWHAITMGIAMTVVGGYAFGSCRITYRPVRVVALAMIYTPSVTRGLRDVRRPILDPTSLNPEKWTITGAPPSDSIAPAVAGLAIAIGCGLGLPLLRHLRPADAAAPKTPEPR